MQVSPGTGRWNPGICRAAPSAATRRRLRCRARSSVGFGGREIGGHRSGRWRLELAGLDGSVGLTGDQQKGGGGGKCGTRGSGRMHHYDSGGARRVSIGSRGAPRHAPHHKPWPFPATHSADAMVRMLEVPFTTGRHTPQCLRLRAWHGSPTPACAASPVASRGKCA